MSAIWYQLLGMLAKKQLKHAGSVNFKIFEESQAEIIYCVDFSVGLEILEDMAEGGGPDVVLVCCGGGGLVSGIASAIKLSKQNPHCKIYGVEPHGCKCSYHLTFLS